MTLNEIFPIRSPRPTAFVVTPQGPKTPKRARVKKNGPVTVYRNLTLYPEQGDALAARGLGMKSNAKVGVVFENGV